MKMVGLRSDPCCFFVCVVGKGAIVETVPERIERTRVDVAVNHAEGGLTKLKKLTLFSFSRVELIPVNMLMD